MNDDEADTLSSALRYSKFLDPPLLEKGSAVALTFAL